MLHVDNLRFGVAIKLHTTPFASSDGKIMYLIQGLHLRTYSRFRWYFEYQAALIKVKHPRQKVEIIELRQEIEDQELLAEIRRKNLLKANRGKLTEFTNKIERYKASYNLLFPIDEQPQYQAALAKIERLKVKITQLEDGTYQE